MRINIIKVGNSKGLILNKTLLEKYQIEKEVNIVLQDDHIIIEPIHKVRQGWDEQFKKAKGEQEKPLLPDVFEDEELLEW